MIARIAALALLLLTAGCSVRESPDLAQLYAPVAARPKAHPLIVIPGIMGSRLHRAADGAEVWPGPLAGFVAGVDFDRLALPVPGTAEIAGAPVRDVLAAGGIFYEIAGRDFYGRLLETLSGAGGYRCVTAAQVDAQTDCVLFAWDWRRGLETAAADLDALVEKLRVLRGDPALRVDIVAHSAGGLVTRYFVRFGGADVLDAPEPAITYAGGRKVRQAVLIGTPNYGSITALQRAITGVPAGLAVIRPETLATMPGMFQLLPHPDRTWMIDIHGRRLELDVFTSEVWRDSGWSIWDRAVRGRIRETFADPAAADAYLAAFEAHFARQLARAARFHRALSARVATGPTKYIVFGSACFATPARCLLEEVDGEVHIRLRPQDIRRPVPGVPYTALMIEPGDGSVTKASLMARDSLDADAACTDFPIAWATFVCERHDELFVLAHYRFSIDPEAEICPLWKDVFLHHWREESQHAIIDELEWKREDVRLNPQERDRAVDDLIELVGAVDGILQAQSLADATYFIDAAGRAFTADEAKRIRDTVLKAYRWKYIVSGVQEPRFQQILGGFISDEQAARIGAALAPIVSAQ